MILLFHSVRAKAALVCVNVGEEVLQFYDNDVIGQ
jgi:hypothetical protein